MLFRLHWQVADIIETRVPIISTEIIKKCVDITHVNLSNNDNIQNKNVIKTKIINNVIKVLIIMVLKF